MEGHCLFMVIAGLLAGSVRCHEVSSHYSGCQWNNVLFLNCRSTGITTLGNHFFLDQTTKNVTSSDHLQRCIRTTTHIDLSSNMMSALYLNVLYKFASLETLNLTNNQIYKLSMKEKNEKGAFLTSLQRLVLNGNRLTAIPKALCKLKSLQTLSLSANRILYVQGDDFANCTNLQHIDLGENRISNIHPDSFRDLRNLQVLKLNSNTLLSLSPLVFLFKHILKADIDLSDNPWVCDCSLQPLKYLISSLSTGVRKPWNATCHTPFSKAGQLILSVEISKSCQTSDYSHVFDKTLLITAGEEATLDCESFNQLRNKDILWWTPHGIISTERQNTNYYLSNTNSLIIKQAEDSDEGLYLCLTNAARIAYQVGIQVNNLKSIRRSPRDLQLRNVRMQTQQNFDLAVSLSVIVTFLIAFFLGVFIRPYLESLWRKWCKSKNAEAQHSDEVYENEGFTPDFTTRKHGAKSNVNSLPQNNTGQTYEMNDNYKLETENISQRQERAIDVEFPTCNAVQEIGEDINKPANRLPRTKQVKWASNEDFSANVNLKYLMSLIKPINFIVLDSSMPDMVYDHQSNNTIAEDFNHISGHTNDDTTKMSDDSCSSDEGSSFSLGSEYDVSDNDSIVNEVLQETKQGGQDDTENVQGPTINLKHLISLLKPIHIIVPDSTVPVISKSPKQNKDTFKTLYDTNSSDESYIYAFDSEYEFSDEDEIRNVNVLETKKSNVSPTVKVPESTTTQIVKSPKQKQFFPLTMPENPENRMGNLEHFSYMHDQDKQITDNQCKSPLPNISRIHYTTALNDSSFSDEESNISVNSDNNFSAEDACIGYNFLKTQTQLANETLSPTVNLKHLISLLRPINITIPDSTMPTVIRTSTQQQSFPINISRYPANKMENTDISSDNHDKDNSIQVERSECYLQSTEPRNQYSDSKNSIEVIWPAYHSSSSEDSSNDTDDSDQATSSVMTKPLASKWVSNENVYPTVKLRQIISNLKPIQIKVPDACHYSETLVSPKEDFEVTSEKLYYYSSSDEHSNDSVDSDHDSTFAFVTKTFPVPAPRKRADSEKLYYSVNLKNIISSLKPIHINIPDSTYYSDTLVTVKMKTEVTQNLYGQRLSETSNDSADSEHESFDEDVIISPNVYEPMATELKNHEDLTPVVNLKYIISSLKPLNIKYPDTTNLLVSSDKNNEIMLYDRSSSDEEFNYLDDLEQEDSYKNVIRGQSLPRPISNESSNDSVDSENDGSTEDVICQLNLTTAMPADWEKSVNVYPTVNLKHVISSLKPFHINVPDSTNYSDPQVFPKQNIEATQKQFDSTSSDESSNDPFESKYESSDEEVVRTPALLPTTGTEWGSIEDLHPTVNLKQIISSLKPINISIPDTTCNSDILVKNDTDVSQKLYDFSISETTTSESSNDSADSENEDSDEKVKQSIILPEATTKWKNYDYPTATVNLKHAISSLKPFHINIPDSTNYSDPQVFPKKNIDATQKLFDGTSSDESSNHPFDSMYENSDEEVIKAPAFLVTTGTGWVSSEDLPPTVNLKQIMSSLKPIHINIPDTTCNLDILVKKDIDVAKKPYDFSMSDTTASDSSDDSIESEHEGSDEEVKQSIIVPEATTECKNHDYPTATVNLKHVISSLKPIHVNVPDPTNYTDPQVFPNKNIDATQKLFDGTSSDESSNDPCDSTYENSDEEVMKAPALLVTTGTGLVSSEDLPPTINLKQIMSSLKPIHINIPDTTCNLDIFVKKDIDVAKKPYDFSMSDTTASDSSDDSAESEHEGSDEEVKQSIIVPEATTECKNHDYPMATVNLKHVISSLKTFHVNVPDPTNYSDPQVFPKRNIEATQKQFDSTSSDESSNDPFDSKYESSDEEVVRTPALLPTTGTEWGSIEDLHPTVNLKQIMSSLKPIHINIPDTTCNLDILVKKDIDVAQKPYDFSITDTIASDSSDDSTESEHEGSDEEVKQSIIFPAATTECKNHDYPTATVNLKHVVSSLKPFHVNVPNSSNYSDPQVFPKKNIDATQKQFDNTSSDESSNDRFDSKYESSDEEVIKTPALLVTTGTEWVSSEDVLPTVNLKQIMSSLKPIHIKVPEADHYSIFPFQTNIHTKDNHPLYDSTLSDEGSNNYVSSSEDIRSGSYVADTAEMTPNLYGSSSDEDSNESSDLECESLDGEMRSAILHIPTLKEAENNENMYATINLKHVISSLKPMHFAVSDSTPYSDTLVHSKKNKEEVTQSSYNSISSDDLSNDSSHSRYKGSDEEVIMSSALLKPPTVWVNDKTHTPTVNLEHVISSFKPICIVVADSYKSTTVVTPKLYDNSSSDESSNDSADLEHECSSEHLMTFPMPKLIQTGQESNENVCPTVNLKHLISLINPIQIKVPDATCYLDIVTSPKENIETTKPKLYDYSPSDESSNSSVDSEHESSAEDIIRTTNIPKCIPTWASNENLSFTVNLRHLMSTFKPLDITAENSTKYLGTSLIPNRDTEVLQKLYGDILPDTLPNDSDNSDSKVSEDVVISNLPETVSTKLPSNEKVYTTVNLKNVISLFKPISIKHIHSTNYSESFIIPTKAVEVSKELYKNSSSDESSSESGHEGSYEVTNHSMRNNSSTDDDSTDEESMLKDSQKSILLVQHSTLAKPTPTEWARNENPSHMVNLRHIISLLKPVKIKIQDSAYHSDSPKNDNSSHDNSSADSEHEYPDKSVIKSYSLPKLTPTKKVPESNLYEDTPMTSKKNIEVISNTGNNISLPNEYSNYFMDSDHEGSVEYMERRTEQERQRHVYPTVNIKHLISLIKPIRIKVPDAAHYSDTLKSSKKKNKVTAEKHVDNSSSDESSKDSSDSEHENSIENMSSKLAKPTLTEWASTEIAYPTVNLKNVTSLLKPINIIAPDSAVPEVPTWRPFFSDITRYKENQTDNFEKYQPVSHSFSQPKSKLHNKHYKHNFSYAFKNSSKNKNVILTSYKKMLSNNTSDNIDEWSHKGLNISDTTNSDLLTSNLAARASNEDDAPVVNLKNVMSLLKPVKFVDPELTMTELVKHPPPVPPRKSRKKFQEQSSLRFHEKPMESRFPVQYSTVSKDLSQKDLIKFDTDDLEEVVL
ncbi:leucine-rich repeat-containing protein 66 [Lithobates pipiens]